MKSFLGFVRKEAFHILRDRQTFWILLLMPLVQVLLFGFAVRTDVYDIRLVIVDPAPGPASRALIERFNASPRFRLMGVYPSIAPLDEGFRDGTFRQAIVLPGDLERALVGRAPVPVELVTDAADPNTGSIMQAYAQAVLQRWHGEQVQRTGGVRLDVAARMRFNPTLESVNLFVPGLIALVLTIVSAMMTAISITREKETGTMEMLLVSPLRPGAIVVGKVVPYVVMGFANVLLVLGAARQVFGMPLRGSIVLLLAESFLYIITALALGIVISTRAETQRTAMIAAMAGLLLPTLMLSGFIFPLESMPAPLQLFSNLVPARWFLIIVRGIMVKGAGIATLWQETLILAVQTIVLLVVGARRLAIRLE
ncbi:MAG TPA: ABC transporter permease [Gemmatimonadaceae bacterium]|jgi:ABC-2 type transport system permease protein|nr:ABC transporter permease [Gemmatimonadaceae bacterium]HMN09971.1 ABC transporter permease [Gemmatimonadaceae bacterium]